MTRHPARPSAEELVETYWPYPHYDQDGLVAALATASALIRWANHATLDASTKTLPDVRAIERATVSLVELATRLPQTLEQVASRLQRLNATDPTLHAYAGDDASTISAAAVTNLNGAAAAAADLGRLLAVAREPMAKLGHHTPDNENDDETG